MGPIFKTLLSAVPLGPEPGAALTATAYTQAITSMATTATKHDAGKPRYDLIPPEALDGLSRLFGMGAVKYDARNWEKGMVWSRVFSAMMRHAWKWFRGESYDTEDGQHHLLSVIWCAMVLYTYAIRKAGEDDRPVCVSDSELYDDYWSVTNE